MYINHFISQKLTWQTRYIMSNKIIPWQSGLCINEWYNICHNIHLCQSWKLPYWSTPPQHISSPHLHRHFNWYVFFCQADTTKNSSSPGLRHVVSWIIGRPGKQHEPSLQLQFRMYSGCPGLIWMLRCTSATDCALLERILSLVKDIIEYLDELDQCMWGVCLVCTETLLM